MARPREHDLGALLDHARDLWIEHGPAGVTIRALSARSGASNGVIYHAFGCRDNLVARVWAREADSFLAHLRAGVDDALATGSAQQAVVTAALASATYAERHGRTARLLLSVKADELITVDLGDTERAELRRHGTVLGALILDLAERLWQRTDRTATALVTYCVIDLPGKLLLSPRRLDDPVARHAVVHAVLGITGAEPPPPSTHPKGRT